MSSKCTAAKAYDILGIYDFPDNFDALNGLHSYLYTNSDMVVEALASQKYDLARDIVTAIETVDKDGSYDDCAFYVSRDGIRILRTAEELIDALGDENGKTASTLLAKNGINVYAEGFQEIAPCSAGKVRVWVLPSRRMGSPSPTPSLGRRGTLGQPSPDI